jgi:hypothetical protein
MAPGRHAAQVSGQRAPHARRAGIEQHAVVDHGGKPLAEDQGHHVARHPTEKEEGQPAVEQIDPAPEGARERERIGGQ